MSLLDTHSVTGTLTLTAVFMLWWYKIGASCVVNKRLSHWVVNTISKAYCKQDLTVPGNLVALSTAKR